MEILSVKDLSFSYPQCEKKAAENISFTINKGEFIALCGATGSGKSTMLRLLKRELSPLGEKTGEISFLGAHLEELSERESASKIGFVMQRPEQQIVTDKVWHELAFGLENMNLPQNVIARRIAETSSYFGIEDWYEKDVSELSGGQKQLLNLASVMAMQPELLILDEPTAQLDPIAASDFIKTLRQLNSDFSLTIIIAEHRLEEIIPLCDRLMVMEKGKLIYFDSPRRVISKLCDRPELLCAMPSSSRLYLRLPQTNAEPCPLTVKEGRSFIEDHYENRIRELKKPEYTHSPDPALEFRRVYFRYERDLPDVLHDLNLTVYEGEIMCILGGNGSGKTTAVNAAAGLVKPYSGSVKVFGKKLKEYKNNSLYTNCLAVLPQDVQTVFLKNTVREELSELSSADIKLPFEIKSLYDKHPYDLSGGEQQLTALAKILTLNPKLLIMDEPTKGLDANAKAEFIKIMKELQKRKITIVAVTHDVELAALCADRCAMFFRGNAVSVDVPSKFFSDSSFYTTAVSRMTRGYYANAVTVEDAAELCLKNGMKGEIDCCTSAVPD